MIAVPVEDLPDELKPSGMLTEGNIDLTNRPIVKNTDGSISTVRSVSFSIDGKEVIMPTVSEDGRIMSNEEAIQQYKRTGKHLGIFKTPSDATKYAQQLHNDQANLYLPKKGNPPVMQSQAVPLDDLPNEFAPDPPGLDYQQFQDAMLPKQEIPTMPEYASSPEIETLGAAPLQNSASTLGLTHPEQQRAGEMLRQEQAQRQAESTITPNMEAQPSFYEGMTPQDAVKRQVENASGSGEVVQPAVDPIEFATFIVGGGIPSLARTALSETARQTASKAIELGLKSAAIGAAQIPIGQTTDLISDTELGKRYPQLPIAFNFLANGAAIYGIDKAVKSLASTDTWRMMTEPERQMVLLSVDDLKAQGMSDGKIARYYPSYKDQMIQQRMTPETMTPDDIRVVSGQFKGPVKDMYNFRLLDYQRQGMAPEQAEIQTWKEVIDTIAGKSQVNEVIGNINQQVMMAQEAAQSPMPTTETAPVEAELTPMADMPPSEITPPEASGEVGLPVEPINQDILPVQEGKASPYESDIYPEQEFKGVSEWEQQGIENRKFSEPVPVSDIPQEIAPVTESEVAPPEPDSQYNPSHLEFIRDRIVSSEPPKRSGLGADTKQVGGYPEWMRDKGYTKIQVTGAIKSFLAGKQLTPKQDSILDDLTKSSMTEYEAIGKQEIYPDELATGQKVVINGEEYQNKGVDPKTGDVILKDGETLNKDPWQPLKVDKVLPVDDFMAEEPMTLTPDTPTTPKTKAVQPDMLGIVEGTMEGKIPAKEAEFPLGQAAEEAKQRKVDAEMRGKQGVLGEEGAVTLPSQEQVKGVAKSWREFWNPLSTIPESEKYLGLRYKTLGKIDRVESLVENIWKKTKRLPDQTKQDMFKFLDGQIDADALPAEVRLMAKSLRTTNNLIGKMLVKRGMLSEEAFNAHKDQYIRYSYLKHILGDKANIGIGPNGKMNLSYLKSRKDLTTEQKRAIGLIEDVSIAEPISVSRPLQDVAKFDMMEEIANNPEWSWQPSMVEVEGKRTGIGKLAEELEIQKRVAKQAGTPEAQARLDRLQAIMDDVQEQAQQMPDGYEQLPTAKTYGPLAGAFVRKEIARDIKPVLSGLSELRETSKAIDMIVGVAEKSMAAFKVGKTAANIPTAFRNVVSGFIQFNMSGTRFDKVVVNLFKAASAIKSKNAMHTQAKRHGVFKTNWGEAEIGEVLKSVREMQGKSFGGVLSSLGKIARYYGKIDDFFKLAKFIEQVEKGKSYTKAAIEAQKWGMDYSRAHPFIKAARRYIAPFASYQYKITPLLAETIAKRPWVIAKYAAIPFGMYQLAKHNLNLTEDDWKKLKSQLPFFVRTNQSMAILPWKSPEGNAQWVNLEYFFPWQNAMATYRDIKEGNYGELTSDFGIGNPLADVYTVAKTMRGDNPPKDPFTGKDIYNRLDSPTEKSLKVSEWIWNKWSPSMLSRQGAAGYTAKIGEKDKAGRTITPAQAAGRWVGLNIIAPTPEQAMKERKFKMMDLKKSLNQILKDPTVSTEKKKRAMEEYQNRVQDMNPS